MLPPPGGLPFVVAHRGASAEAPENTLPAFGRAWATGARWIECDVQPTGDGEFVLLHDDDVDRTTDGSGPIRSLPHAGWAGLDAGSWFGPAFAGTPIPLLSDLLNGLPAGRQVLLEIKGAFTGPQVAALLELLDRSGVDDRVFLESFEPSALAEVHDRRPERPLGLLVEHWPADPVGVCRRLGATMLNPDHRLLPAHVDDVPALHRAGIALWPWTVDDPADWASLTRSGIDGIITNRPAELITWQGRTGSIP